MSRKDISAADYYVRLSGIVSSHFHDKTILVVGIGAGSDLAVKLARLGPKELRLVDPDRVEVSNLCRTFYTKDDLGDLKVEALARHIRRANPFVRVTTYGEDITTLGRDRLPTLVAGVDLIIAGTDELKAQAYLNRLSLMFQMPAVFIGVHERARGGVIVWTIPGSTPCYRCVAAQRFRSGENGGGAPDLHATAGSLLDVCFVDVIAGKIAVSLLERGEDSEFGQFGGRLSTSRTQIIVRTHPEYVWNNGVNIFDVILSDLPTAPKAYAEELRQSAFFALDTLWLPTARDPHCPDCAAL